MNLSDVTRRTYILIWLLLVAISTFLPPSVFAQKSNTKVSVSLITCAPGIKIYELEGHTALRIRDTNSDYIVNWGLFDFTSPNFIYRFVKGDTDYECGAVSTSEFIEYYAQSGRTVTEQILNLSEDETRAIIEKVQTNLLPENRVYRYNYLKDNCATRPMQIIESSLPDTIDFSDAPEQIAGNSPTFRNIMRHFHRNYPWYQFGIDLALGYDIDKPLVPSEAVFAPDILFHMMDGAKVGSRSLVATSHILSQGSDLLQSPTPWYLTPLAISLIALVLVSSITWRDVKHTKVTRWVDFMLFLILGVTGCVVAFLVFISSHEATGCNLVILWLNPLCLCVPLSALFKRFDRLITGYYWLNLTLITMMLLYNLILGQSFNIAFFPLIMCDMMRSVSFIYITGKCRKNIKKRTK